jgi:hypothetical protein
MIFPLRHHDVLTKFLSIPYADTRAALHDPSEVANFSLAELDVYVACLRDTRKVQRARAEMFFYWFPSGLKSGGRIGLAPFIDVRTHGTDELRGVEYGGLIDLRLGTNLLEY